MNRLVSDLDVTRYLPGMITNRRMMEEWIKSLGSFDNEFVVELDGIDIGECSLSVNGKDSAEV